MKFSKSGVVTIGLSDCHKVVLTFLRSYFSRYLPKITYRSFRYFVTKDFLYELESKLLTKWCNREVNCDDLTNIFPSTIDSDSHAQLKNRNKCREIKLLL